MLLDQAGRLPGNAGQRKHAPAIGRPLCKANRTLGKKATPFQRRKGATDSEKTGSRGSQIIVRVGRQRTVLAAETDPATERPPGVLQVETKFLRLRQPAALGDRIDGWRVC